MAKGTNPADTAEAEPAEEPEEPCAVFQGFRVLAPNHTSPQANAPIESFATSTAPDSSSRLMTVAAESNCWVS